MLPNIALIGVGACGKKHLSCLFEMFMEGELKVAAVVSRSPILNDAGVSETVRKLGAVLYNKTSDFFSEQAFLIDLCIIATPHDSHCDLAEEALSRGMHVLVEKPLGINYERALSCVRVARRNSRSIFIGFQDMYLDQIWDVKRKILSKELGQVKGVSVFGCLPRSLSYFSRNNWAGLVEGPNGLICDSLISNAFCHVVNMAFFMTGPSLYEEDGVKQVTGHLFRCQRIESFDTASLNIETSSGVPIKLNLTLSCNIIEQPVVRIECDRGSIEWHYGRCILTKQGNSADSTSVSLVDRGLARLRMLKSTLNSLEAMPVVPVAHVKLIEMLCSFYVLDITRENIVEDTVNGHSTISIRGVEALLRNAFNQNRTCSEILALCK